LETYYFYIFVMAKDFHGFSNALQHFPQFPTITTKGKRSTTLGDYS
jgi:hypothetical protein